MIANNWWERSPNIGNTTNFMNVNNNGNTGNNNNASNVNGVVPGFSILQVTMHKGEIIITMIREGEYNLPYARLAFGKYCGFSFRKSLL